jgi:hypothetical protein
VSGATKNAVIGREELLLGGPNHAWGDFRAATPDQLVERSSRAVVCAAARHTNFLARDSSVSRVTGRLSPWSSALRSSA